MLTWGGKGPVAPSHSLGLGTLPRCWIPVHPPRAPARCGATKLVENYKHTQGHSGAEPASHRAHLIQPETQQLPPSARLRVGLRLFHYLFEQTGLRSVCRGLIVMRDERLRRAGCRGPGSLSHSAAVSSARLISRLGLGDSFTSRRSLTCATRSAELPPPCAD